LVKVGDILDKFALIATAGGTGYTTGAHEHFGLFLNNVAIDPLPYLQGKKQVAPYIEAEIIERPRQSVLIASVASQFYRKDPNGDTIGYLKPGIEYPIIGYTNQVNNFRWAQLLVDNAVVYSALNPLWNKVVDPAPVEVIKEVPMLFERQIDVDGYGLTVALKAKV
jgi:hypothetical protein